MKFRISRLYLGLSLCLVAAAQDAPIPAAFEVASVKPAAPQTGGGVFAGIRGGPGTQDPGRINYVNESLRNLLSEAYGLRAYQIFGPEWIDTERYDIVANVAAGVTKDQTRHMLRKLLADRFQAVIHHESREFPVFELTVAKSGAKLTPSTAATPGMMMSVKNGRGRLMVARKTIPELAVALENEVGTSIIDKTGITGTYDFTLEFMRDQNRILDQFKGIAHEPSASSENPDDGPSLSTALQEQLGLKLTRTRGPLDTIVLDRANKTPTEN